MLVWLLVLIVFDQLRDHPPKPDMTGPSNSVMMVYCGLLLVFLFTAVVQAVLGSVAWFLFRRKDRRLKLLTSGFLVSLSLPLLISWLLARPQFGEDALTAFPICSLALTPPIIVGHLCIALATSNAARIPS
jgi:hypothetical protein